MKRINTQHQSGVALIEVLIAVLIMAFGVVGALGLQAKSLSAMSNAGARGEAVMAAERLLGIMWNDQANLNSYAWGGTGTAPSTLTGWVAETKTALPGATFNITVTPQGLNTNQVAVTINWRRRTADPLNNYTVSASLATAQ